MKNHTKKRNKGEGSWQQSIRLSPAPCCLGLPPPPPLLAMVKHKKAFFMCFMIYISCFILHIIHIFNFLFSVLYFIFCTRYVIPDILHFASYTLFVLVCIIKKKGKVAIAIKGTAGGREADILNCVSIYKILYLISYFSYLLSLILY